uniref:TIGR03016 family PEP-CTERM system-associated outer membrane protein n=1 Tax=Rhodopseudomonas palustris (strain BisA53) TaxID=316055 RepID=Q07SN9_RHOP5
MSKSISLSLVVLCLSGTAVCASDLIINSTIRQIVETNDNYFLLQRSKPLVRPLTTVSVDAAARTPTTLYDFSGDFGYFSYLGPGAENMAETTGTQGGVRFNYEQKGKVAGDRLNFFSAYRVQDLLSAQLADTGIPTGNGTLTTTTVGGGLFKALGLRDTISWSSSWTSSETSSASSAPFTVLGNTAMLRHRVSALTEWVSLADYSLTNREDQTQSETKLLTLKTGLRTSLTKRLDLTANVGRAYINGSQKSKGSVSSDLTVPYPVFSGSGSAEGWLWDIAATYRLLARTRITVSAAHTISADVLGNLSQRESFSAGLSHDLNSYSSIQLAGNFTQYTAPGTQTLSESGYDYLTASATYLRILAREWRGSITYTYRQRETNGTAGSSTSSNGVTLVVSRDVTLLPHLQ